MLRPSRRAGLVLTAVTAAVTTVLSFSPSPASASPLTPSFGPAIEALAPYVGQTICDPTVKPGTAALRSLVERAYTSTGDLGIVRACDIGGQSEHKEGRAWDWAVNVSDPVQERAAQDFFRWAFATDSHGNTFANARRLGLMYMIHNKLIWSANNAAAGWRAYTGPNPHLDHVHISLSWGGAKESTSFWNPAQSYATGTSAATEIAAAYSRLGGSAVVGSPTTSVYAVTGGAARNYTHGRIYFSTRTGAHYVTGGILTKYLALGGPARFGLPTTDQRREYGGWSNAFTGGSIYGALATGAHVVRGGILPKYLALGGPRVLGMPTSDEVVVAGGWMNAFQHGRIYGNLTLGAHVVKGGILAKYLALGGAAKLGLPTSDERVVTGGWASNFQYGRVYGSLPTGAHPVVGPVLSRYLSLGGALSGLGLPTSDPTVIRSGLLTRFQGGGIVLQSDGTTRLTV